MKLIYLLLLFLFPCICEAQMALKGLVVDAEKNTPVPGASVFLNNTSVGTVTNSQGGFELNIPAGRFDLIVSSIGYETANWPVGTAGQSTALSIKLHPKAKELETVVVAPFEKDGWAKWGLFFTENFIGTSAMAADCKLVNPSAVKFRHNKETGELTAHAFEPLIIQNKALGYTLHYDLETFSYNFQAGYFLFQGYPYFEPMRGGAARQKRWTARRNNAYDGSLLHFMRSVYRNKISEQGFEVRALQKIPNEEKARVQLLYRTGSQQQLYANKDSTAYYEKILAQPNEFSNIGKNLLPGDSIAYAMDSVTAGLDFDNFLLVIYKNKTAPPEYRKYVLNAGATMASQITLLNKRAVAIQANGSFFEPADLLSMGYWGWSEKIATMLPFDFVPGK
jgi:hypothetical protein